MKLSIIIVTYKSEEVIGECLKSIYDNVKGIEFEVIVVDNNSQDKTCEIINNDFSEVDLIESKDNLGFAGGVNLGMKKAQGEKILLMNPDMVVLDKAIIDSMDYLDRNKDIGILGCQFVYPDYKIQASFGNFPSNVTELLHATFLHKVLPFGRYVPYNSIYDKYFKRTQNIDWVSGGFMMMRRRLLDKVGYLDESFFMYLEDIDYCKRARKAGYEIVYYPKVRVIHHHMESAKKDFSRAILSEANSLVVYFKKYKKDLTLLKFFIYLRLYLLILKHALLSIFNKESKKMLKDHTKALNELDI